MLRLSVNELSTQRWSFEEDVINYSEAGFNSIGIWEPKLREYGVEKAVELLREFSFDVSSLQWVGGFTGSDGRGFRESMISALDAIQLAADIGAENVVVLTGGRGGHTKNHANRILRVALRELAEAAQAVGVHLAIEPMHVGCGGDLTFLNTAPQCLEIITAINSPNLGLVFDCYHLAQDLTTLPWLESIVPFVKLVQLGDAKHAPMGEQNRCLLGHGTVPLATIVSAFEQNDYHGFYEVEIVGREVEKLRYKQILGQTRTVTHSWAVPQTQNSAS